MPVNFTITGRLVQGDPHKAQPPQKDQKTGQIKTDAAGQPLQQFFMAIAIPKDPAQRIVIPGIASWEETKAALDADAKASWPQFFGAPAPGLQIGPELPAGCTNPKFANKIVDGDGYDDNGKPYSAREGFAGCWVVKLASMFAPKVHEWTANGWAETHHTGRVIKCGDYVSVAGNCVTNQSTQSPGMYMNLGAVTFEKEGPEIVSAAAIDPNAAFGSRGAPAGGPAPINPPHPGTAPAASPSVPAAGLPPSPTAAPTGSYTGYMETPPPAPAEPQLTAKAGQFTYAQMIAAGWTDETLRAQGYLA